MNEQTAHRGKGSEVSNNSFVYKTLGKKKPRTLFWEGEGEKPTSLKKASGGGDTQY